MAAGTPPRQLGWDFGPGVMDDRSGGRKAQSPGQAKAAQRVRETKAAVAAQRSTLGEVDWTGAYCARCDHACSGRHRPGLMGPCKAMGCTCHYCTVMCTCGHDTAEHESWGAEISSACNLCPCPAPRPASPKPNHT